MRSAFLSNYYRTVYETRREHCVRPPPHQREPWIMSSLGIGNVSCMYVYIRMALLVYSEITIAASYKDPAEIAGTLSVASLSTRATSSAHSNFDIVMDRRLFQPQRMSIVKSEVHVWPIVNAMGEKISARRTPGAMVNDSERAILPSRCLLRNIPLAAANVAWTILRRPAFPSTPASVWIPFRELAFRVRSRIITEFAEYGFSFY